LFYELIFISLNLHRATFRYCLQNQTSDLKTAQHGGCFLFAGPELRDGEPDQLKGKSGEHPHQDRVRVRVRQEHLPIAGIAKV